MCGRGSLVTDVVVVFLGFHFFFFSMLTVGNIDRHLVQPCTGVEGGVRAWHHASLAEWIRWNFSYLVRQATGGVLHSVSLVERTGMYRFIVRVVPDGTNSCPSTVCPLIYFAMPFFR